MAYTQTLIKRERVGDGNIRELWSWSGAAVTTGSLVPDTTDAEGIGLIKTIDDFSITDQTTPGGVTTVYNTAASRAALTLVFTANDVGIATIIGSSI